MPGQIGEQLAVVLGPLTWSLVAVSTPCMVGTHVMGLLVSTSVHSLGDAAGPLLYMFPDMGESLVFQVVFLTCPLFQKFLAS